MAIIKAKDNATKKTKQRINNYGPEFVILPPTLQNCGDLHERMVQVESVHKEIKLSDTLRVKWGGWLPRNEIEIHES